MARVPREVGFGRVEQFDDASRAYGVAHRLAAAAPADPRTWRWPVPPPAPLDQGRTSECVPHSWVHEGIAAPIETRFADAAGTARTWYRECKRIDGMPDADGTSLLAGAKVARRHGLISEYRWAFSEPEVAAAVAWLCPVVIGIPWTEGMMDPDSRGLLRPTGRVLGGHAVLVIGINVEHGVYQVLSSWGRQWADRGVALIRRADLARQLRQRGDACVPTQVDTTPPAPVDPDAPAPPRPVPTPPPPRPAPVPVSPRRPRRPRRPRGE